MAMTHVDMEREFGERVRHLRAQRHLSLAELAERSGISRAALSKIERGERNTSLANAVRIAEAFELPLARLLEARVDEMRVVRDGTAARLVEPETGVVREDLLEPRPGLELVRYALPAHAEPEAFPAHALGTRETFVVLEGSVIVCSNGEEVRLAAGDAAVLAGDRDHQLRNPGASTARVLLFVVRPDASG